MPKTKRDMYEVLANSSDDEENQSNSSFRPNSESEQVKILDESNSRSITPTSVRSKTKII